ncbi:MAG: hypothetical protein K2I48_02880 [Muribaculaceae bacterium]|nr:hypothetical protein [Muribaculaceae bacterium]
MYKDRQNKIPQPRTIARHYAEGKYCDYPTDIVLSAVNSHDYEYNPTAIPIKLGFIQIFNANYRAFLYLSEHNTPDEIAEFLENPNGFMENAGVELGTPFDDVAPKIFVAMAEKDMLEAMRDPDTSAVCRLVYSSDEGSWPKRHPERYPKDYMKRSPYATLKDIPYLLDEDVFVAKSFNNHMSINILHIGDFFAEE